MSIINVSNVAQLNSALKAAQAGDTIQLAAGTYTGVSAVGLDFASDVTVTSADANRPATITSVNVNGSSGIAFRDLEFRVDYAAGDNPIQIVGSDHITLANSSIHGSLDGNPGNDRAAMLVKDSQYVTVSDSVFQDLYIGLGHLNSDHLTIEGNRFTDIRMDGLRGGGSSWVTVTGNTFSDFHPKSGDHPDAIQFWTANTTTAAHDIVISDNILMRGDGTGLVPQGIFFGNEASLPYERVTIEGNLVVGLTYNSIAVYGGTDVTIRDNAVVGFTDIKARIRLDGVHGATVSDNEATYLVVTTSTDIAQTGNKVIPSATDEGAAYIAKWMALHDLGQPTYNGTSGADTITGSVAGDMMVGGLGDDVYIVNHADDHITEAAGAGDDLVKAMVTHTLDANVERMLLTGSAAINGTGNELNNTLSGNNAANILSGLGGNDALNGNGGADTLLGGAGDDKLNGGVGDDRMEGGAGNDYYVVDSAKDVVVEGANAGMDMVASTVSYTLPANVENLTLSAGDINGTGNALANGMKGGAGANRLFGLAGNDTLSGLDGADTLNGGAGVDVLSGGTGNDRFIFAKGETNGDRITDFATGDKIELTGWSAGSKISLQAGSTTTWVIKDAASGATETLELANGHKLAAADWLFS